MTIVRSGRVEQRHFLRIEYSTWSCLLWTHVRPTFDAQADVASQEATRAPPPAAGARHGGRHAQTELLAVGPTEPPAVRTWHEPPAVSQPLDASRRPLASR